MVECRHGCRGNRHPPPTGDTTGRRYPVGRGDRLRAVPPRQWRLAVAVGVGTTAVPSVLLMPLWLGGVGYPHTPAFPDLTMPGTLWSVLGHVVSALPVTVGYASLGGE